MKKNKAKDGIVVNAGNGNYIPNIVRGGAAIPIGKKNFYYMQGRKHEQGGIDIGRNAKTGLEVEGEEVMQVTPNEVRVYSSVPFLRGISPAELVLNGVDANKVFAAQEKYKDNNRINDDGTKYKYGGDNRQSTDSINKNTNTFNPNDFTFRSINTLDKVKSVEFKNGNYANYVEIPFNKMDTVVAKTLGNGNNLELNKHIIRSVTNGLTKNPLDFISGLKETVNKNVMESLIKSGTKSKNNIIITDYGKKEFGGNVNKNTSTNQNDFLDSWNTARLATNRYNNQLGDGRLERQAKSRNTAREFHSPIGFAMNYGKQAAIRTPSMSDIDYRKEVARNAQNMKLRLNNTETGQGVIGGAYHAPTHSSYINQEEFVKDPTVRTHENAHASKAVEQEQIISNIIGSNDKSDYLRRPTEIYSRLMQFRQANNINPNTIYDKNSFKELKKNAIDYNLINTFKDEEVIDLLNNVAMSNDPNKINLNNYNLNNVPTYMAKYGTKQILLPMQRLLSTI